jgi:DNA-binding PadR family transcriptional regulator
MASLDRVKLFGPRGQTKLAVLATVAERPGHGYALAGRLNMRLGPAWEIERKRIYELLAQLEGEGLVQSETVSKPGEWHRVYRATPLARQTLDEWVASRARVPLVRSELHAQIGFASPREARALLDKLEHYRRDCLAEVERLQVADVAARGWRSRMIALSRAGLEEQLRAELRWISRARREIQAHLEEADVIPLARCSKRGR